MDTEQPVVRQKYSLRPSPLAAATTKLAATLSGVWAEGTEGRYFTAEQTYPRSHRQGIHLLEDFLAADSHALAKLCREPAINGVDLSSALFLDTETTGLDTGGNTLVFLVGLGYFENEEFRVRQFFLYDPAGEAAMLHAISALVQRFSLLVTFNGKSFDVPMLGARYWPHGQGHAQRFLVGMPHADLLYPARRLWKDRLRSVRLANLERTLLGVRRTGDVAGAEIPDLYLRYLHDGAVDRLLPVFYHNAQDLLTLATLATYAASVYADPFDGRVQDGLDFLCVGRAYEAAGDVDNAIRAYDRALSLSLHPAAQLDACKRITPLYKRTARLNHAVALWEEMVTSERRHSILPYEELAKHCEHVLGDLQRAESLVIEALRLLPLDPCTRTSERDLEKRLRRIHAKLAALPVSDAPAGESR